MLEKPDLPDDQILACMSEFYDLAIDQVEFLPLGADQHSAVYRALSTEGTPYFLKLRRGAFNDVIVTLPKYLHDQGIRQVIPPLPNRAGKLWTKLAAYNLILYPFIEGQNGYQTSLTDQHWIELGAALQKIHTLAVPAHIKNDLRQETWDPVFRQTVLSFLDTIRKETFTDPIAADLAGFLQIKAAQIAAIVHRADSLAKMLPTCSHPYVLCHSDIHGANILINPRGHLYLLDWDDPILAPKERDLMAAGGCQFLNHRSPGEEEHLLYQGYGQTRVDVEVLAYYRYERIIADIAIFCEQIFDKTVSEEDRIQGLRFLKSNFHPNGTIEVAVNADRGRV